MEIARESATVLFVLRKELTGEVLQVAIELHSLDRERGLVGEDAEEERSVGAGMCGAVHVEHAVCLGGDHHRNADREWDVLLVRSAERLVRMTLYVDSRRELMLLPGFDH